MNGYGYPVTILGPISARGGYFKTEQLGRNIFGNLTLRRSHPAPLPLHNEHASLCPVGVVRHLERHELSATTWAVATVWPAAADAIDWDTPRYFSPGGTGTVTNRRCDRNESYDDYDLEMTMDELSLCEHSAQTLAPVIVLGRYDIAEKVSRGGWPTSLPAPLKATLDRAWEATTRTCRARTLDIVDIARPRVAPLHPPTLQRAATPRLDQVRAQLLGKSVDPPFATPAPLPRSTVRHRDEPMPAELANASVGPTHKRITGVITGVR